MGILLSSLCTISHSIRHRLSFPAFLSLWMLYLSLYSVGQTFLSFQWDILLIECGFLTCFISSSRSNGNDIILFLVRWLLFRVMWSSGLVKLQSDCPTWWGLTALQYHYETTCIPTPSGWYFHHLPSWINQLAVVATFILEGPITILYALPVHFGCHRLFRSTRLLAAYSNLVFMALIQFTGNYNFFNVLTAVITVSCFDDEHIDYVMFWRRSKPAPSPSNQHSALSRFVEWVLYAAEAMLWIALIVAISRSFHFSIRWKNGGDVAFDDSWFGQMVGYLDRIQLDSKIVFSAESMNENASTFMMAAVVLGLINIGCCIVADFAGHFHPFYSALCCFKHGARREAVSLCTAALLLLLFVYRVTVYAVKIAVGVYIFGLSLIPLLRGGLDRHHYAEQHVLSADLMRFIERDWYSPMRSFHFVSSYGLFRRMTGVGGRPEIEIYVAGDGEPFPLDEQYILSPPTVLENATFLLDDVEDERLRRGWYRVPFLYKPGDLDASPQWIAPHQPRLDWQMWFAALGRYQHNPWFLSFLYRLLAADHSAAVYDLIDSKHFVFSPDFTPNLKRQRDAAKGQSGQSLAERITAYFDFEGVSSENDFVDDGYYGTKRRSDGKKRRRMKRKERATRLGGDEPVEMMLSELHIGGYPKWVTAVLYHYHYSADGRDSVANTCGAGDSGNGQHCDANRRHKGLWWSRQRKADYFPAVKYNEMDSIRDWMKSNGFLKRPVYDGESQKSSLVRGVRFIRRFYRNVYHQKYDVEMIIWMLTTTVLVLRLVHDHVRSSGSVF